VPNSPVSRDKLPVLKHFALIDLGQGGGAIRARARPSRPRPSMPRARASGRGQILVGYG